MAVHKLAISLSNICLRITISTIPKQFSIVFGNKSEYNGELQANTQRSIAKLKSLIIYLILIIATSSAQAEENVETIGQYKVYYSAFNSDFIQPEVAKQYGLSRSRTTGLVNITVLDSKTEKATVANLSGTATNLLGQTKTLAFKEIREANALYYIAQFNFSNNERFNFKLNIRTPGEQTEKSFNFVHTMYVSK